jgi:hypothetical protein
MKIQDFQLTPSFSFYHDGLQFCCEINFDDQEGTIAEELFANTEEELCRKVSELWRKYLVTQMVKHKE